MLTAKAGNNRRVLRFEITPNGSAEARDLDAPNALPINVWTHVAVALDGRQAVMFVNGRAVGGQFQRQPFAVGRSWSGKLSRSQPVCGASKQDPYFSGQMDSVQISSRTLPIEQITASSIGISNGASTLTLNWPSWTNGLVLYAANSLGADASWTSVTNMPAATNGINFLTLTPTNGQMFFRLQFP